MPFRAGLEAILIPLGALFVLMVLFGVGVFFAGVDPFAVYALIYKGAFGTWFSWQNTLQQTAPLLLTALCVAVPAHLGLVVIGGEGALVLGGLTAVATAHVIEGAPPIVVQIAMIVVGMIAGGVWIGSAGALRHYRGVNETISSLLLFYIAVAIMNHLVEGVMRDPASLNKPSTRHIGEINMIGAMPGMDVHWGLSFGIVACVVVYVLIYHITIGFSFRVVGGNLRAAKMAGLPVGRLILISCFIGGAAAGLAGVIEVAAVHGQANASLIAKYGFTGILVAFIARHNPLAVIPVALLFGGIEASGGLLQRRLGLPDATKLVLQGLAFVVILASETLFGRIRFLQPRAV